MKARQQQDEPDAQMGAVVANFDGAGRALTVGQGSIPQIPFGAWRITGCHIAAGIWNPGSLRLEPINASASVDIRLSHVGLWAGGATPIYTSRPALIAQAEAIIDVNGWITDLQPADVLAFALSTVSGGVTVVTLTLTLKRLGVLGVGETTVTDSFGDTLVDSSGRSIVVRG